MEGRRSGELDRDFIELFGIGPPIEKGIYVISDPCLNLSSEIIRMYSKMIDIVDIRWNPPLILYPENIRGRVKCYSDLGCEVMASGELLENALFRLDSEKIFRNLVKMGFKYFLISEKPYIEYKDIVRGIGKGEDFGLIPVIKVFNVYRRSLRKRIDEYISLNSYILISLDRENYPQHFIRDDRVNWDLITEFIDKTDVNRIIFQTRSTENMYKLLNRVGLKMNIYLYDLKDLVEFENLKLGLIKESTLLDPLRDIKGGVAPKFIYYILLNEGPKTISQLMRISGLPLRTIQDALYKLRRQGMVKKVEREGSKEAIWMSIK